MHRNSLIQKLKKYQSQWPHESPVAQRMIDFVLSHDDCFERTLKIGHITGSAWVVNKSGTHVLLTHHRRLNKWLQLGGHADGDPDILRVAMREVQEESGLMQVVPLSEDIFDIDIHRIPGRGDEPEHDHFDVRFVMQAAGGEEYLVSDESHDLGWIEIDKLSEKSGDESMARMALKWKARICGA